ncbi:ArgE/DapE family deacylase [Actinomadura vinacea]|uniref:ArgE/DapE family deacylase n=1 Tax=Actinomadura vinacea TaxID=115336 RepID=A0ABN3K150_9ACTN
MPSPLPQVDDTAAVSLLQRMVRFDSRTETAGESDLARWLVQQMDGLGLETELQEVSPGRHNAIGVWRGTGGGKSLLFNGHIDTNPVTEGWTVDPWGGLVREGALYGVGVSNMKAGCASYLAAVRTLVETGRRLAGDVVLTFVVGELQGGVGTVAMLERGIRADYFVNCEPTDVQALTLHAGAVNFGVELTGVTRHISKRDEAVDAIAIACELIPELNALTLTGAAGPEHAKINRCNVGVVRGALSRSFEEWRPPQIADFVRLIGSARYAPSQTVDGVLADIRGAVDRAVERHPGLRGHVYEHDKAAKKPDFPPFEVERDSTVVRAVNRAYREVRGRDQPTGAIEPCCYFGSDAAHLAAAGIEGVVCGPGGKFNTMPDERVEIADYLDQIRIHLLTMGYLCDDQN